LVAVATALVVVDVGLGEELLVRDTVRGVWFEVKAEVGKTTVVEEKVIVEGIVTFLEAFSWDRRQNSVVKPTLLCKHLQVL
jgi:hypothetical protein